MKDELIMRFHKEYSIYYKDGLYYIKSDTTNNYLIMDSKKKKIYENDSTDIIDCRLEYNNLIVNDKLKVSLINEVGLVPVLSRLVTYVYNSEESIIYAIIKSNSDRFLCTLSLNDNNVVIEKMNIVNKKHDMIIPYISENAINVLYTEPIKGDYEIHNDTISKVIPEDTVDIKMTENMEKVEIISMPNEVRESDADDIEINPDYNTNISSVDKTDWFEDPIEELKNPKSEVFRDVTDEIQLTVNENGIRADYPTKLAIMAFGDVTCFVTITPDQKRIIAYTLEDNAVEKELRTHDKGKYVVLYEVDDPNRTLSSLKTFANGMIAFVESVYPGTQPNGHLYSYFLKVLSDFNFINDSLGLEGTYEDVKLVVTDIDQFDTHSTSGSLPDTEMLGVSSEKFVILNTGAFIVFIYPNGNPGIDDYDGQLDYTIIPYGFRNEGNTFYKESIPNLNLLDHFDMGLINGLGISDMYKTERIFKLIGDRLFISGVKNNGDGTETYKIMRFKLDYDEIPYTYQVTPSDFDLISCSTDIPPAVLYEYTAPEGSPEIRMHLGAKIHYIGNDHMIVSNNGPISDPEFTKWYLENESTDKSFLGNFTCRVIDGTLVPELFGILPPFYDMMVLPYKNVAYLCTFDENGKFALKEWNMYKKSHKGLSYTGFALKPDVVAYVRMEAIFYKGFSSNIPKRLSWEYGDFTDPDDYFFRGRDKEYLYSNRSRRYTNVNNYYPVDNGLPQEKFIFAQGLKRLIHPDIHPLTKFNASYLLDSSTVFPIAYPPYANANNRGDMYDMVSNPHLIRAAVSDYDLTSNLSWNNETDNAKNGLIPSDYDGTIGWGHKSVYGEDLYYDLLDSGSSNWGETNLKDSRKGIDLGLGNHMEGTDDYFFYHKEYSDYMGGDREVEHGIFRANINDKNEPIETIHHYTTGIRDDEEVWSYIAKFRKITPITCSVTGRPVLLYLSLFGGVQKLRRIILDEGSYNNYEYVLRDIYDDGGRTTWTVLDIAHDKATNTVWLSVLTQPAVNILYKVRIVKIPVESLFDDDTTTWIRSTNWSTDVLSGYGRYIFPLYGDKIALIGDEYRTDILIYSMPDGDNLNLEYTIKMNANERVRGNICYIGNDEIIFTIHDTNDNKLKIVKTHFGGRTTGSEPLIVLVSRDATDMNNEDYNFYNFYSPTYIGNRQFIYRDYSIDNTQNNYKRIIQEGAYIKMVDAVEDRGPGQRMIGLDHVEVDGYQGSNTNGMYAPQMGNYLSYCGKNRIVDWTSHDSVLSDTGTRYKLKIFDLTNTIFHISHIRQPRFSLLDNYSSHEMRYDHHSINFHAYCDGDWIPKGYYTTTSLITLKPDEVGLPANNQESRELVFGNHLVEKYGESGRSLTDEALLTNAYVIKYQISPEHDKAALLVFVPKCFDYRDYMVYDIGVDTGCTYGGGQNSPYDETENSKNNRDYLGMVLLFTAPFSGSNLTLTDSCIIGSITNNLHYAYINKFVHANSVYIEAESLNVDWFKKDITTDDFEIQIGLSFSNGNLQTTDNNTPSEIGHGTRKYKVKRESGVFSFVSDGDLSMDEDNELVYIGHENHKTYAINKNRLTKETFGNYTHETFFPTRDLVSINKHKMELIDRNKHVSKLQNFFYYLKPLENYYRYTLAYDVNRLHLYERKGDLKKPAFIPRDGRIRIEEFNNLRNRLQKIDELLLPKNALSILDDGEKIITLHNINAYYTEYVSMGYYGNWVPHVAVNIDINIYDKVTKETLKYNYTDVEHEEYGSIDMSRYTFVDIFNYNSDFRYKFFRYLRYTRIEKITDNIYVVLSDAVNREDIGGKLFLPENEDKNRKMCVKDENLRSLFKLKPIFLKRVDGSYELISSLDNNINDIFESPYNNSMHYKKIAFRPFYFDNTGLLFCLCGKDDYGSTDFSNINFSIWSKNRNKDSGSKEFVTEDTLTSLINDNTNIGSDITIPFTEIDLKVDNVLFMSEIQNETSSYLLHLVNSVTGTIDIHKIVYVDKNNISVNTIFEDTHTNILGKITEIPIEKRTYRWCMVSDIISFTENVFIMSIVYFANRDKYNVLVDLTKPVEEQVTILNKIHCNKTTYFDFFGRTNAVELFRDVKLEQFANNKIGLLETKEGRIDISTLNKNVDNSYKQEEFKRRFISDDGEFHIEEKDIDTFVTLVDTDSKNIISSRTGNITDIVTLDKNLYNGRQYAYYISSLDKIVMVYEKLTTISHELDSDAGFIESPTLTKKYKEFKVVNGILYLYGNNRLLRVTLDIDSNFVFTESEELAYSGDNKIYTSFKFNDVDTTVSVLSEDIANEGELIIPVIRDTENNNILTPTDIGELADNPDKKYFYVKEVGFYNKNEDKLTGVCYIHRDTKFKLDDTDIAPNLKRLIEYKPAIYHGLEMENSYVLENTDDLFKFIKTIEDAGLTDELNNETFKLKLRIIRNTEVDFHQYTTYAGTEVNHDPEMYFASEHNDNK